MKKKISLTSAFLCVFLGGCASVAPVTNVANYKTSEDLAKAIWQSEETTPFSVSLESTGVHLNTHSYENNVVKQWWGSYCPTNSTSYDGVDIAVERSRKKFSDFCRHYGGQYTNESGFCWKEGAVVFYAYVVPWSATGNRCGKGQAISIHTINPANGYIEFTDWFLDLSKHITYVSGTVNVYKGQFTNDTYYGAAEKPPVKFERQDMLKLRPSQVANIDKKEQAYAATHPHTAEGRLEYYGKRNKSIVAQWKSKYGIGTRVCQHSKGGSDIIPNIYIPSSTLVGYIEGFSDTKVKVRLVEHLGGLEDPNFKEKTIWVYPEKWKICE